MMRAALLWTLLTVFVVRVVGQLAVALGRAPFLPPMSEWYSGLLPYKPLLAAQVAIVLLFVKVCIDQSRGSGYFARPQRHLASPLWYFGWLYAGSMAVRYGATMTLYPERRWTGGTIPIVFHLVLATFLLTLAHYHRAAIGTDGHHH